MYRTLRPDRFLQAANGSQIIDVRSPGEFAQGHIPDAFNIPLFSDQERSEIGAIYKNDSPDAAVKKGLALARPKFAWYLGQCRRIARDKEAFIHCWRGGMRSNGFAGLCDEAGINVSLLEGGYKEYRRLIRKKFSRCCRLIVISGMAGCGKTEILHELKNLGEQVVDLEALARHKGSAFGFIGQKEQPTNEQFENNIAAVWQNFNMSQRIWIEDESLRIGKVVINDVLFKKMQNAVICNIEIPIEARIKRLERDYRNIPADVLIQVVNKIQQRLGLQRSETVIRFIEKKDYVHAIQELLIYYDKGYVYGMRKRNVSPHTLQFNLGDSGPKSIAKTLIGQIEANSLTRASAIYFC